MATAGQLRTHVGNSVVAGKVGPLDEIQGVIVDAQKHNAELVSLIERLETFADKLSGEVPPIAATPDVAKNLRQGTIGEIARVSDDCRDLLARLERVVNRLN